MARKKAAGVVLARLRQHQTLLNRILRDDRISGSRRILGACLAVWMDAYDYPDVQRQLLNIVEGVFSNPQRTRFVDDDEPAVKEGQDNATKNATEALKTLFDEALKENNAVSV